MFSKFAITVIVALVGLSGLHVVTAGRCKCCDPLPPAEDPTTRILFGPPPNCGEFFVPKDFICPNPKQQPNCNFFDVPKTIIELTPRPRPQPTPRPTRSIYHNRID